MLSLLGYVGTFNEEITQSNFGFSKEIGETNFGLS